MGIGIKSERFWQNVFRGFGETQGDIYGGGRTLDKDRVMEICCAGPREEDTPRRVRVVPREEETHKMKRGIYLKEKPHQDHLVNTHP